MRSATPGEWISLCRSEGFDPDEVKLVLSRYRAYRDYYATGRRGEPLALEAWFNWYRMEVASESSQNAPSPSGCSVDDDSRNRGSVRRPKEFLKILTSLASTEAPA